MFLELALKLEKQLQVLSNYQPSHKQPEILSISKLEETLLRVDCKMWMTQL